MCALGLEMRWHHYLPGKLSFSIFELKISKPIRLLNFQMSFAAKLLVDFSFLAIVTWLEVEESGFFDFSDFLT